MDLSGETIPGDPAGGPRSAPDADAALERLLALRGEPAGALSPAVAATAEHLGVATRTVWRWLAAGGRPQRVSEAWEPSEEDVDAYVRWKANAAAAWRERYTARDDGPSLRTFQRAVTRSLSAGDRAVIVSGVQGRRDHEVYLRWEPAGRNQLWEADHKQLDIHVAYPRATKPVRPWVTTFIDGFSRVVMGWAIDQHPTSATVLAALGEAIRVDDRHGPFGGVPLAIRPDRGLEFLAEVLAMTCASLGIRLAPTRPYQPHLKGKIERLHLTFQTELLAELPHYTAGPRDGAGRLWGSGAPLLGIHDLVDRFDRWVTAYNLERTHQGINGQTPLQRWAEDATPLRLVDDANLRRLLLGEEPRRVRKSGIRFHGHDFIAPELNGLVGQTVAVRYRPHNDTFIEVFIAGRHLCTAYPQGILTDDQRNAVLARRRADAAEQARRQRRASRRARQRLAPVTAANQLQDVTVINTGMAHDDQQRWDDTDLRQAARGDLLDLPSRRR